MLWHKYYVDKKFKWITTGLITIFCDKIIEYGSTYLIFDNSILISKIDKLENTIVERS